MSQQGVNSYAFDKRAAARARAEAVQVHVVRFSGTVVATGSGEGLVDVEFPAAFIESPTVSFGGQLGYGQGLVAGQFPTVSVVVQSFHTIQRGIGVLVTGATLILVTTGPPGQVMVVHWQAEGKALSVPSDIGSFNDTGTA